MNKVKPLTYTELLKYLCYEEDTGIFYWACSFDRNIQGTIAGHINSTGYIIISIKGIKYQAHRLAVWYVEGIDVPRELCVDHINTIKIDNRYCNLRKCTRSENLQNSKVSKSSTTKVKGVYKTKNNTFEVRLDANKKSHYLGTYKTLEEAEHVCKGAREKLHLAFANHG